MTLLAERAARDAHGDASTSATPSSPLLTEHPQAALGLSVTCERCA